MWVHVLTPVVADPYHRWEVNSLSNLSNSFWIILAEDSSPIRWWMLQISFYLTKLVGCIWLRSLQYFFYRRCNEYYHIHLLEHHHTVQFFQCHVHRTGKCALWLEASEYQNVVGLENKLNTLLDVPSEICASIFFSEKEGRRAIFTILQFLWRLQSSQISSL